MIKFIIFDYSYSKTNPLYVRNIAVSTTDITAGFLTDEKIAEFYRKDDKYKVLYLDSEEGKEFVKSLINSAQEKYNKAEQEKEKQRAFIYKIIELT